MTDMFLKILSMSTSAGILALVVMAARLMIRQAPRWIHVALWALVAIRLICPFSLESNLSQVPETISSGHALSEWADDYVGDHHVIFDGNPHFQDAVDAGRIPVDAGDGGHYVVTAPDYISAPDTIGTTLLPVLAEIWALGTFVMLLSAIVSYWKLKRQVRMAIRVKEDIYLSENVSSPFVLGIVKPRIYLPYHMEKMDRYHVIAHERTHILRKDHWWKALGYLLLSIHWFNPVIWLSFWLLCRDIELACDERAIRNMKPEQRANYSQALLNCTVRQHTIAACPLAFGEVNVTTRIKRVLRYRKPALWASILAIVLCAVILVCFMTDPKADGAPPEASIPAATEPAESTPGVVVTMRVDNVTPISATVIFDTAEEYPEGILFFDEYFTLQRLREDTWEAVPTLIPEGEYAFPSDAIELTSCPVFTVNWGWLYGDLPPGTYQITKSVDLRPTGAIPHLEKATYNRSAVFTIEASDTPVLMPDNVSSKVCVAVVPTELGSHCYAVIPDQEQAKAAFEEAMAAQIVGAGRNGAKDIGIFIEYAGTYLYLTDKETLLTFDGRIEQDAAEPLYRMALDTARQVGWEPAVTPEQIHGIAEATLQYGTVSVFLRDEAALSKIEDLLSASEYLYGGAGCPFGNLLTLKLESGETLTLSMAADSCAAWLSNGVYYDYGHGNEEFYGLFMPHVIYHQAQKGIDNVLDSLYYLHWGDYAALHGIEETFALMDALGDWAVAAQDKEHYLPVLSVVGTLDGAYAEYFSTVLNELYQVDPTLFAGCCMEYLQEDARQTVIMLLAGNFGMGMEDTEAMLSGHLSE